MRNGVTIYCDKCDFGVFVESILEIHNKTKTHEIKSAFCRGELVALYNDLANIFAIIKHHNKDYRVFSFHNIQWVSFYNQPDYEFQLPLRSLIEI